MTGRDLLKEFKRQNRMTQPQLAACVGLTQAYLSLLLAGKRIPGLAAARIEAATGGAVPASSWLHDLSVRSRNAKRKPSKRVASHKRGTRSAA